jgi:hypothetical protein
VLDEVLDGRFRITGLLGSGGMGQVWAAEDERMRRDVAVKVVHPQYGTGEAETQARFQREVQLAGRLSHQNIVTVHDWGEVVVEDRRKTLYLVMELVRGVPLHRRLKELAPAPWPLAVGWAAQITQALDAAHRQGVVHRDIKPANVLLTPEGTVKVLDFGVAKFMGDTIGARDLTVTGAPLGSPMYMSPEQAEGARKIDHRSDLYSLGCLLYHAVTGRPPFTSEVQWAVLRMQMQDTPIAPASHVEDLPPGLNRLILHLLAKRPEERPADAAAVHDALTTVLVDQAVMQWGKGASGEDILGAAELGYTGAGSGRMLGKAWEFADVLLEEVKISAAAERRKLDQELAERRKAAETQVNEDMAWAEQLRARTEQQARRLLDEVRAQAEQALSAAHAEAEQILRRARFNADRMLNEADMRLQAAGDAEENARAEMPLDLQAMAEALAMAKPDALPPGPRFELTRRGYDTKQVDEHLLGIEARRDRYRADLFVLQREFIEREVNSQTSASSSEEEREAVRRSAEGHLADVFAPGLQHLARSQREVLPKSDVPEFELVRRGYDREQVERRIKELRDEQQSLMYRIMELRRLPEREPREPNQH